MEVGELLKLHT